jgi:hypothetical protein
MTAVVSTSCPDLKLIARGKVRDLYEVDEHSLLFVATDRISAFDVIMKNVKSLLFLLLIRIRMNEKKIFTVQCDSHLVLPFELPFLFTTLGKQNQWMITFMDNRE